MTPAPVVEEQYSQFTCPNQACPEFNQPGRGNIRHRSWTGAEGHLERLRCTICRHEFSECCGTLMSHSKLPEDTVEQLVICQRWGVCDAGTAKICGVDIKTVHRFQRVAASRAQEHHQQVVQQVAVAGVQLDEAHSKLRPNQVEWIHTALAMGSLFLLWVEFGPRTTETAARLIAQVVARLAQVPLWLTEPARRGTLSLPFRSFCGRGCELSRPPVSSPSHAVTERSYGPAQNHLGTDR